MEAEFQFLKKTMKKSLKLSPYNPEQKLRLIIDGSRTIGTGFILIQYINDDNVKDGIKIINAGSALLPQTREFSSMEAECIALDRVRLTIPRIVSVTFPNYGWSLAIPNLNV